MGKDYCFVKSKFDDSSGIPNWGGDRNNVFTGIPIARRRKTKKENQDRKNYSSKLNCRQRSRPISKTSPSTRRGGKRERKGEVTPITVGVVQVLPVETNPWGHQRAGWPRSLGREGGKGKSRGARICIVGGVRGGLGGWGGGGVVGGNREWFLITGIHLCQNGEKGSNRPKGNLKPSPLGSLRKE